MEFPHFTQYFVEDDQGVSLLFAKYDAGMI
jgi:hypothetical protein